MTKFMERIYNFIGHGFNYIGGYFCNKAYSLIKEPELIRYQQQDPNETKRINYPLSLDSLVVDIGGFDGKWSSRIFCRYGCRIDIYEPNPDSLSKIYEAFKANPKITVFEYALSNRNGTDLLYGEGDLASLLSIARANCEIVIRRVSEIFNERYANRKIDLLKLNIEGAEYDLLPDLIQNFGMRSIKNIQIQFHRLGPDYENKRKAIQDALSKTHIQKWNYDFIYESWEAKP